MTYSIVARDGRLLGVAAATGSIAVGSRVTWARAGVGAVATQAYTNPALGPRILELLESGMSAEQALRTALAEDSDHDRRQVLVVDAHGHAAAFTGSRAPGWAGHIVGRGYACAGNLIVSREVVEMMAEAYEAGRGLPLWERLLRALEAGEAAGGDQRGLRSAALLVVCEHPIYGRRFDRMLDLRVDYSDDPLGDLRRLLRLNPRNF